eukprot:397972-Pelagomonas_calceolata.AAC.1
MESGEWCEGIGWEVEGGGVGTRHADMHAACMLNVFSMGNFEAHRKDLWPIESTHKTAQVKTERKGNS